MSFDFGYLVSTNPAAGYASQYNAVLLNQLQQKINQLQEDALMDDFERGYEALLEGDTKKAIRLWEKEAQLGVIEAHVALGDLYQHRMKNLQKATFHYQKAYESGETKAGALILAAKLSLGKIDKVDLEKAPQDVKEEPWFKYIKVSLALRESTWTDLIFNDENGEKTEEILEELMAAIDGGVLPAGTLFSRLYCIDVFFSLYVKGESGVSKEAENYFLEIVQSCAENGDPHAAEIYLLWLVVNENYIEAKNFIKRFDSQFEWPEERSYDVFGLCKGLLLLPIQEKSVTKMLFSLTKNVYSSFGSGALDSFTSDWEQWEQFRVSFEWLQLQSEEVHNLISIIEEFGIAESRRVLSLKLINRAFLLKEEEEEFGVFGTDDDGVLLHLYFYLSLARLCIEGWELSAEKKKADPQYVPFIPVLNDFVAEFFGQSGEFDTKWNSRKVAVDSIKADTFNQNILPELTQRFESLKRVRSKGSRFS